MERIFAPYLRDPEGRVHRMAVAEMAYPGAPLQIYPFRGETHSTRYIGTRVALTISNEGRLIAVPEATKNRQFTRSGR